MARNMSNFYVPGAQNQMGRGGGLPNIMPGLSEDYRAQKAEQNRIKKLVLAYKANPGKYGEDEALQLQQMAVTAGIPFELQSSAGARWLKGGAAALDTALFGLLPNDLYTPVNAAERKAVAWGGAAGYLIPWGAPARVAAGGFNVLRGLKGVKGLKGLKSGTTASRFGAGFSNPVQMLKTAKMFGGTGKNPINAAGNIIKTKTTPKAFVYKGKTDKEFFKFMGQTTKKGKGFNKAIAKGKTPAEQEKLALAWLKKNMDSASYKRIGVKRLRGWVRNVKLKVKKPKVKGTLKHDKKGRLINPNTKKPFTSKELVEINRGGGPLKNKVFEEQVKKDIAAGRINPATGAPYSKSTPMNVNKPNAGGRAKVTPQQLIALSNKQNKRNQKVQTLKNIVQKATKTGGKTVNKGQTISNSTKRVLRSNKALNKVNFKEILAKMPTRTKNTILRIKDKKIRHATAKKWAIKNLKS